MNTQGSSLILSIFPPLCYQSGPMTSLSRLNQTVVLCRKCARLVRWREASAKNPRRRYQGERYWAKPLPGFGDPHARGSLRVRLHFIDFR